jgi:hypothetical protein
MTETLGFPFPNADIPLGTSLPPGMLRVAAGRRAFARWGAMAVPTAQPLSWSAAGVEPWNGVNGGNKRKTYVVVVVVVVVVVGLSLEAMFCVLSV